MIGKKIRDKSIAEQIANLKSKHPLFHTIFTSPISLKVNGQIRPTSRSSMYNFVIKYNLATGPQTRIVVPQLRKNDSGGDIPHLYPNGSLCLYRPKYQEFTRTDFLSDTIIPWTSLWLYYYEQWHITGNWLGGGEHPEILNSKTNEKRK